LHKIQEPGLIGIKKIKWKSFRVYLEKEKSSPSPFYKFGPLTLAASPGQPSSRGRSTAMGRGEDLPSQSRDGPGGSRFPAFGHCQLGPDRHHQPPACRSSAAPEPKKIEGGARSCNRRGEIPPVPCRPPCAPSHQAGPALQLHTHLAPPSYRPRAWHRHGPRPQPPLTPS
jgi:hypothetical protein